jgi:hypothetical protein
MGGTEMSTKGDKSSICYLLGHQSKDGDHKIIGIFSNKKLAVAAKEKLSEKPGFNKFKRGFYVDKYDIDRVYWDDGFVTYTYVDGERDPKLTSEV